MLTEVTTFALVLVLCMLFSAVALVLSTRNKTLAYRLVSIFCFLCMILFLGEAFQLFSVEMFNKLFGIAIANIAYSFVPFMAFCFGLYLTNREKYFKSKYFIILLIIPIFKSVGGFVNCFIPIFYTITVLPTGFIELTLTNLYNALDVCLLTLCFISILLVIIQSIHERTIKKQFILFICAILSPILVLFLPVGREILPLCYFLALIFFWWAILGYELLDSSIAHKEFIDSANLGMIFFNSKSELVEINQFAKELAKLTDEVVGKPVDEIFSYAPKFLEFFNNDEKEVTLLSSKTNRWFRINKTTLYKKDDLIGYLFVFEDITGDMIKTRDLEIFNSVMLDVENTAMIAVSYRDKDGKYHWSEVAYQILERDPRPEDDYVDIFSEVSLEYDSESLKNEMDDLQKDEVRTRDFKIKTESGKIKFIAGTLHKIYDNEGNFLRLSMSTQDVTEITENNMALAKSDHEKNCFTKRNSP